MSELVRWDRAVLRARRDDVLDVYAEAMDVHAEAARTRYPILTGHLTRDGLTSVAAVDGDRLVGIAYGYLGAAGQWWHDQVRAAVEGEHGAQAAAEWMENDFEVCELHVRPPAQGTGLGRRLLDALLDGQPATTALLTTPDAETRARRFYRAGGWQDLVRGLRFPCDTRTFAVLGLRLPGARLVSSG